MSHTPTELAAVVRSLIPAGVPDYLGGIPRDVKLRQRADGSVYPYAIVYPSPGTGDRREAATLDGRVDADRYLWDVQVTVASGDPGEALEAARGVDRAILGVRPFPDVGRLRHPEGEDVVTMLRDDDKTPPRWYVPLRYRCMT